MRLRGNESDAERIAELVGSLEVDKAIRPDTFGYDNAVSVCLDAVLSINRQYKRFVVPRLESFRHAYPDVRTLDQLAAMLALLGDAGFAEAWKYRHAGRIRTLHDLVARFREVHRLVGAENDLQSMRGWANRVTVDDWSEFGVPGIGLATFQYLRMMLGVSTVKPDIHIKRVVSGVLGRAVGDVEAIALVEAASAILNLPATTVDHSLWRHSSGATSG